MTIRIPELVGFLITNNNPSQLIYKTLFILSIALNGIHTPLLAQDTDGDAILDVDDLDDDNDGILDFYERYVDNPTDANPNTGVGNFPDQVYIFNWTDVDFNDGLQSGDDQTFTLSNGLVITATFSSVVSTHNSYVTSGLVTGATSAFHQLYNTAGAEECFLSTIGGDILTGTVTFTATKNGNPFPITIIAFDAESTGGAARVNFTTNGGDWYEMEQYNGGAGYNLINGNKTIEFTNTSNRNSAVSTHDATVINFEVIATASFMQGFGFGMWLTADTDNDDIPDHLDKDSDADGCADAIEGAHSFFIEQIDANDQLPGTVAGTGIPSIALNGQGIGTSKTAAFQDAGCVACTDTDLDGICDATDLDDDNDGIADAVEGCTSTEVVLLNYISVVPDTDPFSNTGLALFQGIKSNGDTLNIKISAPDGLPSLEGKTNAAQITDGGTGAQILFEDKDGTETEIQIIADGDLSSINFVDLDGFDNGANDPSTNFRVHDAIAANVPGTWTINNPATGNVGDLVSNPLNTVLPHVSGLTPLEQKAVSDALYNNVPGIPGHADPDSVTNEIFNANVTFNLTSPQSNFSFIYEDIGEANAPVGDGDREFASSSFLFASFTVEVCTNDDYDGDGIVNTLDTDSDNDGCPDAIEGGGGFTLNDLTGDDRLTGTTNASTGIPDLAGTGQTIGDSQDSLTQSPNCCTPLLLPNVSLSGLSPICDGESVTFSVTDSTNGGSNPTFQWFLNGVAVHMDSNQYTNSTLVHGDTIAVVMTSLLCAVPLTDTATFIMQVNPLLTPNVSMTGTSPICAGDAVTFTVTDSTNGGSNPTFAWFNNSTAVHVDSNEYTTTALNDGDTIKVVMTSNETCASPTTDTATFIMQVNPLLTPNVSMTGTSPICAGDAVTFTVTDSTNGGSNPTFAWFNNSTAVHVDSNEYTTTALNDGDTIKVVMTSNETCASPTTDTATFIMQVNPLLTPNVSMTGTSPICAGDAVTFTVTDSTNGGSNPTFAWFNNSTAVHVDSNEYTTTALNDGDTIKVVMTSNEACASPTTDTATFIMQVNPLLTPNVSMTGTSPICAGDAVTFTVTDSTNGGSNPTFTWFNNSTAVHVDSNEYTTTALNDGDTIKVVMTSNEACANPTTDTATFIMQVNPLLTPNVSMTGSSPICAGDAVTFTVTDSTNGGSNPTFTWFNNSTAVHVDSNEYTTTALNDGDTIKVVMTSNETCANPTTDTATFIMQVNPLLTPNVSMTGTSPICAGDAVTFTVTDSTNGGSNPTFAWFNNSTAVHVDSNEYTTTALNDGDTIKVVMTSNETCANPTTDTATFIMQVNPLLTPNVSMTGSSPICAGDAVTFTVTDSTNGGSNPTFAWFNNSTAVHVDSNEYTTTALNDGDTIKVVMTSNETCANPTTDTATFIMQVNLLLTPNVSMTGTSPICAGDAVTFTVTDSTNGGSNPTFAWFNNSTAVHVDSNEYTTTALNDGDTIKVVMTSNETCASPTTDTATFIMQVNPLLTPNVSMTGTSPICAGDAVTFTVTDSTNGGSNPTFAWFNNSTAVHVDSNEYTTTALNDGDTIKVVMTSNETCASPTTDTATFIMQVNPLLTPNVSMTGTSPICAGDAVTFTVTDSTNGGSNPTFAWFNNSTAVHVDSNEYTTTALNDGDTIKVVMTSNEACANPTTDTATFIMQVNPLLTPNVSMTGSSPICAGDAVTFTVTDSTNGGSNPTFTWFNNSTAVHVDSNEYTTTALNDGDTIKVVMTSNETCASPTTDTATFIMQVNPLLTPNVSMTGSSPICAGDAVTFTVTDSTNGGSNPTFTWFNNSTAVHVDSNEYTTTALNDGDTIKVVMTSNETCASPTTDTATFIMQVNPLLTPNVSMTGSSPICAGDTVTFSVTDSTNGGSNPTFAWFNNSTAVHVDSNEYTTSALSDGDTIKVVMTSNETCANPTTDTATFIMQVNPLLTPNVSMTGSSPVCAGDAVTFTVTDSTNGGSNPTFAWFNNSTAVHVDSNEYTTTALNDGDTIKVVMTSNETCASPTTDTATFIMQVNPLLTPNVSMTGTSPICAGDAVTFTVTDSTNGGSNPTFAWFNNSTAVHVDSNEYTTTALNDGDTIKVVMTSNEACASPTTDTATFIMQVNPLLTPNVSMTGTSPICAGDAVTFTVTDSTNGGSNPTFAWFNNSTAVHVDSNEYTTTALNDGDTIKVVMTSNETCASPTTDTATFIMQVNPLLTPNVSMTGTSPICAGDAVTFTVTDSTNGGSNPTFAWFNNSTAVHVDSNEYTTTALNDGDTIKVVMTSNETCASPTTDTATFIMQVNPLLTPNVSMTGTSPICAGDAVTFTVTDSTNGGSNPTFTWFNNSTAVHVDSNEYTTTALNDGDTIKVVMTSNETCASPTTDTATFIMQVNPLLTPNVSMTGSSPICAGDAVTFNVTDSTNGGSNPTFAWFNNSTAVHVDSNEYTTTALNDGDTIKVVMTSNETCASPTTDTATFIMQVNPLLTPNVSMTGTSPICAGDAVTFTVTDSTNGGSNPTFAWFNNSTAVHVDSNEYTTSALSDGDTIKVVMTSNEACANPTTDTATFIMQVNPLLTPNVSMTGTSPICAGDAVTFTVTDSTNGGSNPTFAWFNNSTAVHVDSNEYTTTALNDGDTIKVVMTSNETCASPTTDTATFIMQVNPLLTPNVSMTGTSPICAGDAVTFTVTDSTNGGSNPTFAWFNNSTAVHVDSNEYTTTALNDGDTIKVVMTSNETCASPTTDTATFIMQVNPLLTPNVSMTGTSPICAGDAVTFTVTDSTNGGSNPTFAWFNNSTTVHVDSNEYTTTALNDGDTIKVVMTSNETCLMNNTDTSFIVMSVSPAVNPSVSITIDNNPICSGDLAQLFVTDSSGGGSNPAFQWYLNGVLTGPDTSGFSSNTFNNGDSVSVIMTSSLTCAVVATDTASIIVNVNPNLIPNVSMTGTSPICAGDAVTFTVTDSTNGGSNPTFAWFNNSTAVHVDSNEYTTTALNDGDTIKVVMTSNETCASPTTDTATFIMQVNPLLTPNVSMTGTSPICTGDAVTFTVTDSTNGGSNPTFAWFNNSTAVHVDSNEYTTTALNDGDTIKVVMTSNETCASPTTDTATFIMQVNPLLTPNVSMTGTSPICAGDAVTFTVTDSTNGGSNPTFAWFNNSTAVHVDSNEYTTTALNDGDTIKVVMTSNEACASPTTDTATFIMQVNPLLTPNVSMTGTSPICAGDAVTFTVTDSTNGGSNPTFAWFNNSTAVHVDSNEYTTTALNDGDTIKVVMTSNETCASPTTDTATFIMQVNPLLTPNVSMTGTSPICAGDAVTFTVTDSTNGGSNPTFAWFNNSTAVHVDSNEYTTTALNDGDTIKVVMTSNETCASPTTDTATFIMQVNPLLTPNVSMTGSSPICAGDAVTFNVTDSTNGGSNPTFAWFNNSTAVHVDSNEYTTTALNDGDTIKVVMTSNETCASPTTDTATFIMQVNPLLTPNVSMTGTSPICAGDAVTFTVTDSTNGGSNPTFAWFNNSTAVHVDSNEYTTSALSDGDTIKVVMTSNEACANPTTDTATFIMQVNPLLTPNVSMTGTSPICAGDAVTFTVTDSTNGGSNPTFAWFNNSTAVHVDSNEYTTTALNDGDTIKVVMTSNETCASPTTDTATFIMQVNPLLTPNVSMTGTSPICAGDAVTFSVTDSTNGGSNPTFAWFNNSTAVHVDSNEYTTSALSDGDTIKVVMTSNETCASPTTDTATFIMQVNPLLTPNVSMTGTSPICAGDAVTFTVTDSTNGGSNPTFTWFNNSTAVHVDSNEYTTTALNDGDTIKVVMTSNETCANPTTDTATFIMQVNPLLTPNVSMTGSSPICAGDAVTFTVTDSTNGGSNPTFAWFNNSTAVHVDSNEYTTTALNDGDTIKVVMTSNETCASPTTDTATFIMQVNPLLTPNVSMTGTSPICAGDAVTFTVTDSTNGGSNPTFAWFNNSTAVHVDSNEYTTTALNDGDTIKVVMTSNETCASPTTDTATFIMQVNPLLTPNVSMTGTSPICAGDAVTFTVTDSTNGGSNPTFAWFNNSTAVHVDSNEYTTTALNDGDTIKVVMTSNETCASPTTDTATFIMQVNPLLTPNVSMTGTSPICAGDAVTFSVTDSTNGGSNPTFAWFNNSIAVHVDSNEYTTTALNDGDTIKVVMTSNETCANPTTDTATFIMQVNPLLTPNVSMTGSSPICAGDAVTFTVTDSTNGGSNPTFAWFNNSTAVHVDSNEYTTTALNDGDTIKVVMTSNETCASPTTDTATFIMQVNPLLTPNVSMTGTSPICAGDAVTFSVTDSTNGGSNPTFAWFNNSIAVHVDSNEYTTTALNDGDTIKVVMTSNETCANPTTDTATFIMQVNPLLTPNVSMTGSSPICAGDAVTFTVTDSTNGGSNPTFAWFNNSTAVHVDSNEYTTTALNDGDTIKVVMTSNETCASPTTDTATFIMQVNPLLTPNVSMTGTSPICAGDAVTFTVTDSTNGGSNPTFAWFNNSTAVHVDSNEYTTTALNDGDTIKVVMTSNETCASPTTDTATFIMQVNPLLTPNVSMTGTSPICAGDAVTFTVTDSTNGGSNPTFAWFNNSTAVHVDSNEYTTTALNDGDTIKVVMTPSTDICYNGAIQISAYYQVQINELPFVGNLNLSEIELCYDSSETTISMDNYSGSLNWQWSMDETNWLPIANQHNPELSIDALNFLPNRFNQLQTINLRAIAGNSICPNDTSASTSITVYPPLDAEIDVIQDCDNYERLLSAIPLNDFTYYSNWQYSTDNKTFNLHTDSPDSLTIVSTGTELTQSGYYMASFTNDLGCTTTRTVNVEPCPNPTIEIPNVLTDNNDSQNDSFWIRNIWFYPNSELKVYNRWGSLVYQNSNYKNNWYGTNNFGNKLPEAVYYYILELNDKDNQRFHGDVTIFR